MFDTASPHLLTLASVSQKEEEEEEKEVLSLIAAVQQVALRDVSEAPQT